MYTTIFAAVIAVVAVLFIVFGLLKGRKYVWIYSALKIGALILAAVSSFLISTLLFRNVIARALNMLVASGQLGDAGAIISDIPSAVSAVSALIAMIIAPFLFWALFALFKKIFYFVAKLVSRALIKIPALAPVRKDEEEFEAMSKRKQKKLALRTYAPNPIGMVLGGVLGLLLFFVGMVPILGTVGVANDIVTTISAMDESNDPTLDMVNEITMAADENFMSKAINTLGAKPAYDSLTTYKVGTEKATLSKELNFVAVTGKAVYSMRDYESVAKEDAVKSMKEVGDAFEQSTLIPVVAADLISAAEDDWSHGKDFHGISKPSLDGLEDISEPLFDALADSDAQTLRADVHTIVNVLASVIEHDAVDKFKSGEPITVFEDTDLSYEIVYELFANERLAPMVGELAEVGFNMLGDQFGADFKGLDIDSSNIKDKDAEAHELADVLGHMAELVGKVQKDGFDAFTLAKDFGPLLDEIDHTSLIGHKNTAIVLKGIFTSHDLYSQIGLSKEEAIDIADSINEKSVAKGYTPLIVAVLDTIDIIKMSTDKNISNAEMVAKVEVLLADLTIESAELLQEMTSESVMISKGAPAQSAKPISDMFSSAFSGLAEAKESGMSEEQYNKEAKAMTDMMNVAMNFENTGSNSSMFGQSSATGVEADEFVNNVFESSVISSTIVDTAYGENNEVTNDPLNFGRELGENDRNAAVNALNNQWSSATEEQRADTEYQKTYVAIGALMNMNITVTDGGIVA